MPLTGKLRNMRRLFVILSLACAACASAPEPRTERWWKGNLHTHSLWSDGADFPEMIAAWYKEHGYNFLAITEHDMLQTGERWVDINAPDPGWPPRNASTRAALPDYRSRFGKEWVQEHVDGARHLIRLRALQEYRGRFEEADRFMFIMGEEITDKGGAHINAFNLDAAVLPRGGATTAERIRNNMIAIGEQRARNTQPILAIVNHPNYVWSLKAEELAPIQDVRLFEVYNGHRLVNNAGDSVHPSTERMWDIILTMRHQERGSPLFGVATDDAHEYRSYSDTTAMPGRGWVMVRSARLSPNDIVAALAAGDFYASTGVTLQRVNHDTRGISIRVQPETGVTYTTQFIGSRRSDNQIGVVLKEMSGVDAEYKFTGDERYVRAVVTSTKRHPDPISGKLLEYEKAWIQPVMK